MKKYSCDNCNNDFDEPEVVKTTYEEYYGVLCLFDNTNPLTLELCPRCGCDSLELNEEREEDDCEHYKKNM